MKRKSRAKRAMRQQNVQCGNKDDKDRLSNLPDGVLHHIMSFLNVKDVVRTCILSTRWKHLWKHVTTITLTYSSFKTDGDFTEFVNRFLSLRDSSTVLNAIHYELRGGWVKRQLLENIVSSGASQYVNRLHLSYDIPYIPPSLFSISSLTSLFSLSSLTSLDLCIPELQNPKPFCISSITLLNLSISMNCKAYLKIELSTPNLCTFAFIGKCCPVLIGSSLSSIKQVSIDVDEPANNLLILLIFNWLKKLVNLQSLTVSLTILQALSSSHDLVKLKPPFWHNLKSLKVKLPQNYGYPSMEIKRYVSLVQFLLQNSLSAKASIIRL